jgi:hypothetical protein
MVNLTTAVATLQGYLDSIERIIGMFSATPGDRREIRYATAILLESVSREYRRHGRLLAWEREHYEPAMHRLFMELRKTNLSTEPGVELLDSLYRARLELTESIDLLERSGQGMDIFSSF